MIVPRIIAAIFVGVLISSLALVSIGGLALMSPTLAHGSDVKHNAGTIVAIGPGTDFVLEMTGGQTLHFHCRDRCLKEVAHMQRHLREHAHTDVYYVQDGQNGPVAVDVD